MNRQYDLLDVLNILSFVIGLLNYNENLTQNDKQELLEELDNQTATLLEEIHAHLKEQDIKIEEILNACKGNIF